MELEKENYRLVKKETEAIKMERRSFFKIEKMQKRMVKKAEKVLNISKG